METGNFEALLAMALEEDLGDLGDVTSQAIFPAGHSSKAVLVSKDAGILCGIELFQRVFAKIDRGTECRLLKADGDRLGKGDEVAELSGSTLSILKGERTAINFLGFLSGIATKSAECRAAAATGRAIVLDTRKTLPGYRALSKYAVRVGGASNHRQGLYDMVLIKDNHLDAAGSMAEAVGRVRRAWGDRFRIEVEARSAEDARQALALGVDWIMLDNMGPAECALALTLPRPARAAPVVFEASGNMDGKRIAEYSALGLDRVSVGALTHSVRSFDFSLRMREKAL